jgi:luciferase family oxidoreductase group 1
MLSHYSPLKVAENFRMLETLFPGRIDLGIGRAPGSDQRTAQVLAHDASDLDVDLFPGKVADLIGFLHDSFEADHPFTGIRAMPDGPGAPELWLLGSSDQSAALAAHFGTAFSFAHFINSEDSIQSLRAYATQFRRSPYLAAPPASLAVFVLRADTESEAMRLARSRDLSLLRVTTGRSSPYPSVQEAEAYPYTDHELAVIRHNRQRTIAGAPEQVRDHLVRLGAQCGVDEFVIVTITHDSKARVRSYELLAQAFDLRPRISVP